MNKTKRPIIIAALTVPVIVASIPTLTDAAVQPFKDISKNSPYYEIIHKMSQKGIISGFEDGTFKPEQAITRKHAAALVSRAKDGSLPVQSKAYQFKDVSKSNPNYDDIRKLQQAGIFEPDKNGNFHPNKVVNRAEMAKILTIAFDLEVRANYDFPDVPASHTANKYVRAIYSNGITTGDNGKFLPNESLSRAHYAVFMHRAMNADKNHVAQPAPTPKPEKPEKNYRDTGVVTDKYDSPSDVPTPPGYKKDTFLAQQTKKHNELRVQNKHRYNGATTLFAGEDSKEVIEYRAKQIGISTNEFRDIIDYTIKTGEVFDGGSFALFYNYGTGQIYISTT